MPAEPSGKVVKTDAEWRKIEEGVYTGFSQGGDVIAVFVKIGSRGGIH